MQNGFQRLIHGLFQMRFMSLGDDERIMDGQRNNALSEQAVHYTLDHLRIDAHQPDTNIGMKEMSDGLVAILDGLN